MNRVGVLAVAAISMVGLLLLIGGGSAFATHVTCGETITQDTTLDSDLLNCPADGLIIGADNITLDLNGHTILGAANLGVEFPPGVRNTGHGGVTIENGTIQHFHEGVRVDGASDNLVRGLQFSEVAGGVSFADVVDSTIANNFGGPANAIVLARSDDNRVVRNAASHIQVCCGGENNVVERNSAGGLDITFAAHGTVVERNTVTGSFGIQVLQSNDVHIDRNTVSFAVDGIFVWPNSVGAVLSRNITVENTGDGIDVNNPNATLSGNRADNNGDLGIEAVAGVIDGGGNRAFGNGNPLQCLHVVCK